MTKPFIGFALAVSVCAAAPLVEAAGKLPDDELLRGGELGAGTDPPGLEAAAEVLALSDEMRTFVEAHVNLMSQDVFKLQQLVDAIMDREAFGLEYDENTRTAAETFAARRGNCLSFSNMFVALAREAGLAVGYQEVDIPPDWSMRKDVFVLNRHVNVRVDLGPAGTHVVDFNISDFKTTYDIHVISDRRAIAHHFNNLGVEHMQSGEVAAAFACFRRAVEADDGHFSPAWTNLGTLYRKSGLLDHAESAYLRALKADKQDGVAMSNLVALYEKLGDADKAEVFRRRVTEHRMHNPYYRFRLAREAFFERDYETAVGHLKYAIRHQENEDQFHFLLGLCHLMQGEDKEARECMRKAEELAATDAQRRRYETKIRTLLAASEKVD